MRNLRRLDQYRITSPWLLEHTGGWAGDDRCGAFNIPSPIDRAALCVVASSDMGWDHVSVSRANRCPNWPEMARIKETFFLDTECAMQLHVPVADHVNNHPNCLHLWRPHDQDIPRPPAVFVGVASAGVLRTAQEARAAHATAMKAAAEMVDNGGA